MQTVKAQQLHPAVNVFQRRYRAWNNQIGNSSLLGEPVRGVSGGSEM